MTGAAIIFGIGWLCWATAGTVAARDSMRGYDTPDSEFVLRSFSWTGFCLYLMALAVAMGS